MRSMLSVILMGTLLSVCSLFGTQFKINYKRGAVYVKRGGVTSPVRTGQLLYEKDIILTKARSFAAIGGSDGTIIKVSEKTVMTIRESYEDSRSRNHKLSILKGKIFAHVSKLRKRSKISYETPSVVVAVRGTTLVIDVSGDGGDTKVYVKNGQVSASLRDANTGRVLPETTVNIGAGQMGKVSEDSSEGASGGETETTIETRTMSEDDREDSEANVPQEFGTLEEVVDQAPPEEDPEEQQAQVEVQELKAELKDNIVQEQGELSESKQRVDEQREWDQTSQRVIGDYNVSQFYKQEGNKVTLVSVTEDRNTKQVSVLSSESTYSSEIPSLITFLSTEDSTIKADVSETRFVSSNANNSQKDDILFINYKDQTSNDQLFFNGQKADPIGDKGFILRISTNTIAPQYLITFTLPDPEDSTKTKDHALTLSARILLENSKEDVTDILSGEASTVSSDQLTSLINQGLYGRLVLDERDPNEKLLNNNQIIIILIGGMLIPVSTALGGL